MRDATVAHRAVHAQLNYAIRTAGEPLRASTLSVHRAPETDPARRGGVRFDPPCVAAGRTGRIGSLPAIPCRAALQIAGSALRPAARDSRAHGPRRARAAGAPAEW
ncbi:hypothetical protein SEVIR_2G229166v4 [Setaria viridis]